MFNILKTKINKGRKSEYVVYGIRNEKKEIILTSRTCESIKKICKLLNTGELEESWVKNAYGSNTVLRLVELVETGKEIVKVDKLDHNFTGVTIKEDTCEMRIIYNSVGRRLGGCDYTCEIEKLENVYVAWVKRNGEDVFHLSMRDLNKPHWIITPEKYIAPIQKAIHEYRPE